MLEDSGVGPSAPPFLFPFGGGHVARRKKSTLVPINTLEAGQECWLPFDPNLPEVPARRLVVKYHNDCRCRVYTDKARQIVIDGEVKASVREEWDIAPMTMVVLRNE